ncbi:MAG: hypothetical protein KGO93_01730 [Cyanobacteria bacterium REEB446]|nr:hypothetical protein [Cyanobacteria bacterium REEB446]
MTFIGVGFGKLSQAVRNFGQKELDAETIKSQLASFPFNNHAVAKSHEGFAKTTLAYLLTTPGAKFQDEISRFIDIALPNFINTQQARNNTYDSQAAVFSAFKGEFNTLISDMLGMVFQGSDKNPKAQAQKQAFEDNLNKFWSRQSNVQETKHADDLEPLIVVVNNPFTHTSISTARFTSNPATVNVAEQMEARVSSPVNAPAAFDPMDLSALLDLSTSELPDTFSKVKIPHAQLREYAQAYGDLLQGTLSESVLKLAIDSVNPGIKLDVASAAIPEIEKFIKKCLEADGIRLAEGKDQNINFTEIKTLINSPEAQENLNNILKAWGLEYDFKTNILKQNAFIEQVPDYIQEIAQLDISDLVSEKASSNLKINNHASLASAWEAIVDNNDPTIKYLSFIDYPDDIVPLVDSHDFLGLIKDSGRSDLIIELPYSLEALEKIKNLKAQELEKNPEKLMPEIRFIHASLEDSSIDALRGLIKQAAAKAEPNAEISPELKPTLEAYAGKTLAERNRVGRLLTLAVEDGGYGLDAVKHKPYIDYVLNAIAPESVKGFNDVYGLQEYQGKLAETFKNSLINNSTAMPSIRNPIQAVIEQARRIEENFKSADNLPKISNILENALFAAKPDTEGRSYLPLAYFYWVERGLSHPDLLKTLALENKSLKHSALNESQTAKLLKSYFEIATTSNELEKNKKLSQLISEGFTAELLIEKFKLIDTLMGAKYDGYLSQNSSYDQEARPPLSRLAVFDDLRKSPSQQVSNFIEKEIKSLKSVNPSPIRQVSEESISLYKQLFISAPSDISFITQGFLFNSLINSSSSITDEAIRASTGRIDKLIEDFCILDSSLIPSLVEKLPHLKAWAKPLLDAESSNWQGENVSVHESLNSYKDLDLQKLLNHGKQILIKLFMTDNAHKPGPSNPLYKTDAERQEVLDYISKFNTTAKPVDNYRQEFEDRAKAAFLNSENKTPEAFNQAIDLAHARVNLMQNDSFDSPLRLSLGHNLYPLVETVIKVSSKDQEALRQVQSSLKTDNSASSFLNLINLNGHDLIQLGVEPEQASPENLARYMRYQESPDHAALRSDMQARYKELIKGDKPASHAQAITLIHQEFSEFLQAYDNSQLAPRLEAIGKKLEFKGNAEVLTGESVICSGFTKLSASQAMRDFSLDLGSINPTNILNEQRIKNFIDSHSYKLADGSLMLALPNESPEQERHYVHLDAEGYQEFSKVMANYLAEGTNLNQANIRKEDLIIYPSVPELLDNVGGLLNTGSNENTSKLLLLTNPELKFQGMTFINKEGVLLLPKGLTEAESPLLTTQESGSFVSKDSINLAQNAFKVYTLASGVAVQRLEDFTPTNTSAHNLNLGDFAKEALSELNAKQSQEKEEKTLIADTFKSLQSAAPEEVNARFVTYENKQGTLPSLYKNLAYNNLFLKSLEINQINPVKAAEYLTKTLDKTLSDRGLVDQQKTKFIEGLEKMFKVFEAVYLEIFSNAETISGAALGEGKIKPLMENQGIQEYFKKNQTAGVLTI